MIKRNKFDTSRMKTPPPSPSPENGEGGGGEKNIQTRNILAETARI